jgi:hypothetical protein
MNYRGEHTFKLSNQDFTLAMEYERIEQIEKDTGIGIIQLARLVALSQAGLHLLVAIIYHASGGKVPKKTIGDLILKEGIDKIGPDIVVYLRMAFSGGVESSGDVSEKEPKP